MTAARTAVYSRDGNTGEGAVTVVPMVTVVTEATGSTGSRPTVLVEAVTVTIWWWCL